MLIELSLSRALNISLFGFLVVHLVEFLAKSDLLLQHLLRFFVLIQNNVTETIRVVFL